jgi:nitrate reductase gamma subunit
MFHACRDIKAGGFSFSTIWLILRNIQDPQVRMAQTTVHHLAAISLHLSQINHPTSPLVAIPPAPYAPDPALSPSGSSLQRAIVYWLIGLVFAFSAIFIAIIVKQKMRGHRVVLQSDSRPWEKAKIQELLDGDVEMSSIAMDTMYRLFQVSIVILLLGHANFFLFPVGYTIFIPTVLFGLIYIMSSHP